jgi:hypothetical protein
MRLSVLDGDRYRLINWSPRRRTDGGQPLLVDDAPKLADTSCHVFRRYFQKWKAQLPTPNFLNTVRPLRHPGRQAAHHLPGPVHALGIPYYRAQRDVATSGLPT